MRRCSDACLRTNMRKTIAIVLGAHPTLQHGRDVMRRVVLCLHFRVHSILLRFAVALLLSMRTVVWRFVLAWVAAHRYHCHNRWTFFCHGLHSSCSATCIAIVSATGTLYLISKLRHFIIHSLVDTLAAPCVLCDNNFFLPPHSFTIWKNYVC